MERNHKWLWLLCAAVAATGCGDDGSDAGAGGAGGAGGEAGGLGAPALEALDGEPAFAVVNSDFSSSSIAVLDADFRLLDESWLDSGTTFPGLVATLSGDIALPTRQPNDGTFGVIDRLETDVYSEFYAPSGNLKGQVRARFGASGFSSNPYDVLYVDERSAWITRYEPNLDPEAAPEDQGNDLIEIDLETMSLTGRRIDLSELNTIAQGAVSEEAVVYARPNRGVVIGSTAVVGLDLISADFSTYGRGAVAVIDLEAGTVEALPMPATSETLWMQNCGHVVPVPGSSNQLVVSCAGPYEYDAEFNLQTEKKRARSGVVLIEVSDGVASIERSWSPAVNEEAAAATSFLIALDEERVVGVADGDFNQGIPDTLYITELATGEQAQVHAGSTAYVLGLSAYDAEREILLVPDASANAVFEFAIDERGATELGSLELAPNGLPPRQIYWLN